MTLSAHWMPSGNSTHLLWKIIDLSFFTSPTFDLQLTCIIFPAGMVIFILYTLTSGVLLQLLSLCCISSTKDFILDLSTLSKTVCRILTIVPISVLFCRRCLIALNPKIVLFIFCVFTKKGTLISVDLSFCLMLTFISIYPSLKRDVLVVTPLDPDGVTVIKNWTDMLDFDIWKVLSKFFYVNNGNLSS